MSSTIAPHSSSTPLETDRGGRASGWSAAAGHFRWVICALLFFGTTKNYMDRQILGLLKHTLQSEFHWTEVDYSNLVVAFQLAYACGMVVVGRVIDRLGTRLGYAITMVFWSIASMSHAFAGSLTGFLAARAALGFGESGVIPAGVKSVAEWFPKKERALATGIFNSGTNIGAVLAPLIIPWITIHLGWRWSFILVGAIGFLWLAFWLLIYRSPEAHPGVSARELAYIRSDPGDFSPPIPWKTLLRYRQTWSFIAGKTLSDPVWWFYLFWAPDFLQRKFALSLGQIAAPLMTIYILADIGSIGGGWLPSLLIRRGATVNAARKRAMLACAFCVIPVAFANHVSGLWSAVLIISLAASAHQGFSANLLTLPSDMFPAASVASVAGLGGMAGAMSGMFAAKIIGYALQWTGSYQIPFLIAGAAYFVALGAIQLIVPKLEPISVT